MTSQILTIQFELETAKDEWQRIMLEQDEGHESFEDAMERFCIAAINGKVDGRYYFREECVCFYGALLPRAKYTNVSVAEYILDEAAAVIARKVHHTIRERANIDGRPTYSRTYIERLLDEDCYDIEDGVSIFTESEESGDDVEFLRELYCLCYPYCSEEWRAANPLSWALNHLSEELHQLTEGQVPAIHCGY